MANTIQDKLAYLEDTKKQIKQAIVAKGVSVSDADTFRSYAGKITSIQSGGGGTVNIPDNIKFGYSTFKTIPDSIIPYLESRTDLSDMFAYCASLKTVPLFDTSNIYTMESAFYYCSSLESLPHFNTANVRNMNSMFFTCSSLESVPLFDTSKCTIAYMMFYYCEKLTEVPQFDTSSINNMSYTFYGCRNLKTVPLLNVSKVTEIDLIFDECPSLTNLGGFTGLKLDLNLAYCSLLTVESVMNVINNAEDMTSDPKTLTLHQDVFNKLSSEQIATASAKGWNIAAA